MTCFRLKDGTPVTRLLPYCRYIKFRRLIEEGYETEKAYKVAKSYSLKNTIKRDKIRSLFKREPSKEHFRIIEGCVCRRKCSAEEAIKWAVETGRIKKEALK